MTCSCKGDCGNCREVASTEDDKPHWRKAVSDIETDFALRERGLRDVERINAKREEDARIAESERHVGH